MTDKKICIYAICKNELKFVKQWLDNVQEADYIVVLDTGSTDGTYEALKADPRVTKVKQKVISPWRFDNARNESMKLIPADAEILICTDFDELLSPGWAKVIKDNWQEDTNRMYYDYAWSHNEIGEPTDIFVYDKIHTKDFKWKFPVHEVLWPKEESFNIRAVNVGRQIFLQHYPDSTKERHYYFDLLELAVKEHPEDSHERMLLAREYLLNGDYDNALENYMAVLNMPDVDAPEKRLVLLESLGRCADIFKIKETYDTAIWYCQEFIKEDWSYREPYLIMAEIYNEMKMPTLAEACVNQALKYGTRKNTWVERANTWVELPDDILSITYYQLNDYDKAIQHVIEALKHKPNDPRLLKNYTVYLEAKLEELKTKAE